tara:strand:- start:196 stop:396 length:201 start_codon:yes stop_codon:yes gene_type:complete
MKPIYTKKTEYYSSFKTKKSRLRGFISLNTNSYSLNLVILALIGTILGLGLERYLCPKTNLLPTIF